MQRAVIRTARRGAASKASVAAPEPITMSRWPSHSENWQRTEASGENVLARTGRPSPLPQLRQAPKSSKCDYKVIPVQGADPA